ncbi:MAG: hypothetical protein JWM31_2631 [Solirubrobacterales bacterium]|nr:hypothetical protein [Solirubrobacterales bacterium]
MPLVVLLRGINVGKAKQVPMAELRALLAEAGYGDPRTLLRSGNAVVASDEEPDAAARRIEDLLAQRFGFPVDVVVRPAVDLDRILAADPFTGIAEDPSRQLVAFLGGPPDADRLRALTQLDHAPGRLVVADRELHLWCPDGQAQSTLAKELARAKLGTTVTVRNWRTVQKLAALAASDHSA